MYKGKCLGLALAAAVAMTGSLASAEGDAANGERVFKKTCKGCHTIAEGGKNGIGPALWNVGERKMGTSPKFRYSKSYVTAGEKGFVWTEANIVEYLVNPKTFIRKASGDPKAKSRMNIKVKKEAARRDVAAYLMTQK